MLATMNVPRFGMRATDPFEVVRREMEPFERFLYGNQGPLLQGEWSAPVALWEDDEHILLEVEVPGCCHEDLELTIHQGNLRLFVDRKMPEDKREYWFNERCYGRFDRIIPLPEAVDADSIDAELHDGILHVVLTKKPEAYSKRILIRTGNGKK